MEVSACHGLRLRSKRGDNQQALVARAPSLTVFSAQLLLYLSDMMGKFVDGNDLEALGGFRAHQVTKERVASITHPGRVADRNPNDGTALALCGPGREVASGSCVGLTLWFDPFWPLLGWTHPELRNRPKLEQLA